MSGHLSAYYMDVWTSITNLTEPDGMQTGELFTSHLKPRRQDDQICACSFLDLYV
jgi:hypothetical protein